MENSVLVTAMFWFMDDYGVGWNCSLPDFVYEGCVLDAKRRTGWSWDGNHKIPPPN